MSTPVSVLSHDFRVAESLLEISHAVGSVMEISEILDQICRIGARAMGTDTCSAYILSVTDRTWLELAATFGLSRAEEVGARGFRLGDGVPGWAAAHNKTVALSDAKADPRYHRLDDTTAEERFIAYLCTPLRIQDEVVGVLSVRRQRPCVWSAEEILFAEIIAKQVAIVLEKARLYREKMEADRLAAIAISLSEVAHYIKNVLQGMSGGGYFVESGLKHGDLDKARRGWDLHKRSTDKIRALVENMLNYTREKRCELEEGDINALIARLAGEIETAFDQHGIRLEVAIDELIPHLMIDKTALHDAMLNLVTNAMDAIPPGRRGEVRIVSRLDLGTQCARIEVSDNGAGIPEDIHGKMFNLFFSTKGRNGTGIGLAVTKKIIDEHGGKLSFTTVGDEGTTFTIELPLVRRIG